VLTTEVGVNKIFLTAVFIAGTSFGLTPEDKDLADRYLKLPSTIQLIEADPDLKKLNIEDIYTKLLDEGIIEDLKMKIHLDNYIKKHPDYDKLLRSQKQNNFEILPQYKYLDLENPRTIPGLPWEGAAFESSLIPDFQNELGYHGTATCIAKIRGNIGWFKEGPQTQAPWDAIIPLMDCVAYTKKRGKEPMSCYIAGCSPAIARPDPTAITDLVRDIIIG